MVQRHFVNRKCSVFICNYNSLTYLLYHLREHFSYNIHIFFNTGPKFDAKIKAKIKTKWEKINLILILNINVHWSQFNALLNHNRII